MNNELTYRFQTAYPWAEFAERRNRIYDAIGPDACAVLQGGGAVRQYALFRQTNEFFYLTGIATPQAYVVLNGKERSATLFLPVRGEGRSPDDGGQSGDLRLAGAEPDAAGTLREGWLPAGLVDGDKSGRRMRGCACRRIPAIRLDRGLGDGTKV